MSVRPSLIVLIFLLVCAPIVCCLQNEKPEVAQLQAPIQEPWSTETLPESIDRPDAAFITGRENPERQGIAKPHSDSDPFHEKKEHVIVKPEVIAQPKSTDAATATTEDPFQEKEEPKLDANDRPPTASLAMDEDVILTLDVTKESGNRVRLIGDTNFLTGTKLTLQIEEDAESISIRKQSGVVVRDGRFRSKSFSLSDGRYVARAALQDPSIQPKNVSIFIGRKRENLKGPLVKAGVFGPRVILEKTFSIGENPDQAQAVREKAKADAAAVTAAATVDIKQKMCVLLQQLLNFKDKPQFDYYGFAADPGAKWLENVNSLMDFTRSSELGKTIPYDVRVATGDLYIVGSQYVHGHGRETAVTVELLPDLKKVIGYEAFLRQQTKR